MRWFVDISLIGSGGKASRFCVEAEQWQKALQAVREKRQDASPFANFSIELLEDGYRAIDPATRTRYVVQKAPDDASVTDQPVEIQGNPSVPPPAAAKTDGKGGRARRRGAVAIPNDPVPTQTAKPANGAPAVETPAPAPAPKPAPPRPERTPTPAPIPRPMQAETAFEKMTQGVSFPLAGKASTESAEIATQILPPFKIVTERTQMPSDASPILYKEIALAVAEGTTERDAEAIVRAQFELIRAALRGSPAGQFIQLAVFDHEFQGRPKRPPAVTLSFKDWRDKEPAVSFTGSMSLPPPPADTQINPAAAVPPEARRSEPRSEPPASAPHAPAPPAPAQPAPAPPPSTPPAPPPSTPPAPPPSNPPASRRAPPPTPSSIRRAASTMDDDVTAVKADPPPASVPRWTPPPQASAPIPAVPIPAVPIPEEPKPVEAKPVEAPKPPPASKAPPHASIDVAEKTAPMTAVVIPPAPESVTSVGSPPTLPSEIEEDIEIEDAPVAERRGTDIPVEAPPAIPVEAPPAIPDAASVDPPAPAYDATARIMGAPIVSVGASAAAESEKMAPTIFEPTPSALAPSEVAPPAPAEPAPPRVDSEPPPPSGVSPAAYSSPGSTPPPAPWGTSPTSSDPTPERASLDPFPPPAALTRSNPPPPPEARPASIPPAAIPSPSTPPMSVAPGTAKPRSRGDDLIAELFESMSDIEFLSDPLDGAEFALRVTLENLPSELAIVSFFSLDSREFVAVRVAGTAATPAVVEAVLLKRASERSPLSHRAMRSNQAVVLDAATAEPMREDPRWAASNVLARSVMIAPVQLGGRYLGLIEVANPLDGEPFTSADGNALTYIGQQLAEFLGQRDTTVDPERVRAPKLSARMRR